MRPRSLLLVTALVLARLVSDGSVAASHRQPATAASSAPLLATGALEVAAGAGAAYRAQVERYRRGERLEAIAELSGWPDGRVHREVGAVLEQSRHGQEFPLAAALLLQTESARRAAESRDRRAFDARLEDAAALAGLVAHRPADAAIAKQWYEAVGYDLIGWGAAARARGMLERGLKLVPDDPELLLALGVADELEGSAASLATAEKVYRRVLDKNPDIAEARLRHGRVLGELGRTREGLLEIEWVLDASQDPRLRCLALLFQGRAAERQGRLADAIACYRSAAQTDAASQTANLALGRVLDETGDRAGATAALAEAAPSASRRRDDAWWLYRFGRSHAVGTLFDVLYRQVAP